MILTSRFASYTVNYCGSFSNFLLSSTQIYDSKPALVDPETNEALSFAALKNKVQIFSGKLVSIGVAKKDVVASVCGNSMDFVALSLAVGNIGAVFAPLNPAYKQGEILKYVEQLKARWIFTDQASYDKVIECRNQLPDIRECQLDDQTLTNVEIPVVRDISDTALIFFSSGTTGLPKGVRLSHRSLIAHVRLISATDSDSTTPMPRIASNDNVFGVLPYFHAGGLITVYCMLSQGTTVYVNKLFKEESFFNIIERHKITVINVVPPILNFLLGSQSQLSSLRMILVGASSVDQSTVKMLQEALPNVKIIELYGLTEVGILTLMSPIHNKPNTTGVLMPGFECRLVDGEMWFRSPTAMSGYLQDEQTREMTTDNLWIRSGDLGHVDVDGYFSITGRVKELIKVRGWQVSPKELEDALRSSFPQAVHDCCVIGVPDAGAGQLPRAYVVLKREFTLTEHDIQEIISQKFISYKHLKGGVQFVEDIPKNASGKVDRCRLLREFIEATNAGRSA
ncbi:hypothetical protein QR680_000234 [Steinernema hermaphroditum]|uniref:AMP-dependent synthetase/ligase domain-containing protein n=1 Tax=Steinernema hermaphroditum TaxID=289476 RepID=A0AA39LDP5_9BILA|nr:hypothetical protein QR680_000234 [Steinernema hermaphroditum]